MRSHIERNNSSAPSGGRVRGSRLAQPVMPHIRLFHHRGHRGRPGLNHKTFDAVFQMERVKIDEKADWFAANFIPIHLSSSVVKLIRSLTAYTAFACDS